MLAPFKGGPQRPAPPPPSWPPNTPKSNLASPLRHATQRRSMADQRPASDSHRPPSDMPVIKLLNSPSTLPSGVESETTASTAGNLDSGTPTPTVRLLKKEKGPLPIPKSDALIGKTSTVRPRLASTEVPAQARKPHGSTAPAIAVSFGHGKAADFFPWTGADAEDVLNEHVIKSGFSDRLAGPNQTESNTARPSLWPSLKNKSGLPLLSALFVQVLEKRQNLGRCTAPSSFKPPPRVTLTDAKREAWLRDLADPAVPLRKLSRTIPHGIRGKILLDQCIGKEIPFPRAVWLAKCVGANELRAFRRKGVSGTAAASGESKWIKDWTALVEQFIQETITQCGQPGWQARMNYAVRLAAHFFSEGLLDTDHYSDQLLTSFETATLERLPVWIVLVQLHWRHITAQQKRGQRLADVIVRRITDMTDRSISDANKVLVDRLRRMLLILSTTRAGCLIAVKSWTDCRRVLDDLANTVAVPQQVAALRGIVHRNDRLSGRAAPPISPASTKMQLVHALDTFDTALAIDRLALRVRVLQPDIQSATTSLLEWASSSTRAGRARAYLAARLVRQWRSTGIDTDSLILVSLNQTSSDLSLHREMLYVAIAELMRSDCFGLGRYLQWLISMGLVSDASALPDMALVKHIPMNKLSANVATLRATVMRRLGYDTRLESADIQQRINTLSGLFDRVDSDDSLDGDILRACSSLAGVDGTVKYAVSDWLVTHLSGWSTSGDYDGGKSLNVNLRAFHAARMIFESLDDYSALATVLVKASNSDDLAVLSSITDTVCMHAEIFAAQGVLMAIKDTLLKRHIQLRGQKPLDRRFLQSLVALTQDLNDRSAMMQTTTNDLLVCEQQSSVAACSPASDSMASADAGDLSSDQGIDRILSSGNSMDEQLLSRTFVTIMERVSKASLSIVSSHVVLKATVWLEQLRRFDPMTIEQLGRNLVLRMSQTPGHAHTTACTASLVASGCLKLEVLLNTFRQSIEDVGHRDRTAAAKMSLSGLQILLSAASVHGETTTAAIYPLRLARKRVQNQHRRELVELVACCQSDEDSFAQLLNETSASTLLRDGIVRDCAGTASCFERYGSTRSGAALAPPLLAVLFPANNDQPSSNTLATSDLVSQTNELSVPYCQFYLRMLSRPSVHEIEQPVGGEPAVSVVLKSAIEKGVSLWPQLLNVFDKGTLCSLFTWSVNLAMHRLADHVEKTSEQDNDADLVERLLHAAELTASPQVLKQADLLTELVHQLKTLNSSLSNSDDAASGDDDRKQIHLATTTACAHNFVRLSVLFGAGTGEEVTTMKERAQILVSLCNLFSSPSIQSQGQVARYAFDAASLHASHFSADDLTTVSRQLSATARSDSRVAFILGTQSGPESWLVMASRVNPASHAASALAATPGSASASSPSQQTPTRHPQTHPLPPRPQTTPLGTPQYSSGSSGGGSGAGVAGIQHTRQASTPGSSRIGGLHFGHDFKYTPFPLRKWEIMPDPTPNVGENDTSLSLTLFAARKAI